MSWPFGGFLIRPIGRMRDAGFSAGRFVGCELGNSAFRRYTRGFHGRSIAFGGGDIDPLVGKHLTCDGLCQRQLIILQSQRSASLSRPRAFVIRKSVWSCPCHGNQALECRVGPLRLPKILRPGSLRAINAKFAVADRGGTGNNRSSDDTSFVQLNGLDGAQPVLHFAVDEKRGRLAERLRQGTIVQESKVVPLVTDVIAG